MSEPQQTAHSMNPRLTRRRSLKSTDRGDFKRLRASYLCGPAGYAHFIKRAALELADQETSAELKSAVAVQLSRELRAGWW